MPKKYYRTDNREKEKYKDMEKFERRINYQALS
jgi:hypothetical protein